MIEMSDIVIDESTVRGTDGFYRVAKDERGHWWFLNPAGEPWIFKGVAGLNRAGTQGGRLAKPGPYHDAIGRKFGEDPEPFVQACFEKMREVGFNAAGAWVTEEFFDRGVPYTDILEFVKVEDSAYQVKAPGLRAPDVFDPRWLAAIDRQAEIICTPRRESTELVGYFTDNELGFGQPNMDHVWGGGEELNTTDRATLLQSALSLEEDRPLKDEAWRFVMERRGSLEKLAEAWEIELTSRDDLQKLTAESVVLESVGYGEDQDAFSRHFARQYFKSTAEAIRKHDPNHLILGSRFGGPPGINIGMMQEGYVDVMTSNNYRDNMYERINANVEHAGDMPLLIGEFSWASDYFRVLPMPGEPAEVRQEPTQGVGEIERVRRKGRVALEQAFTHPSLVGYTWYRWVHKWDDPDRFHYGFVNMEDEVNRFNAELLSDIHPKLEGIKLGQAEPASIDG